MRLQPMRINVFNLHCIFRRLEICEQSLPIFRVKSFTISKKQCNRCRKTDKVDKVGSCREKVDKVVLKRKVIVLSMAQLLHFLSHSHLGSIIMNDMRRQQFVLIKGQLKLVDVDDVGLEEPRCSDDFDCRTLIDNLHYSSPSSHNNINSLKCINSRCSGFNERKNVFNAAKHFTTFLLPYGAPDTLKNRVEELIAKFQNQVSSDILLEEVIRLKDSFAKGLYMGEQTEKVAFRQVRYADLIGLHDYSCKGSSSFSSCRISVSSVQEAKAMCQSQEICRAFVWTNEKSWTGRNIVYFKNNATNWSLDNRNTTLYVKLDL
uniref:Uncharacterized protein n=1 Tax=Romanomermis culicivorax TaxID=13658 RepID=A0A915JV55_ROMCU